MSPNRDDTQSRRQIALSTHLENLSPRKTAQESLKLDSASGSVLIDRPEYQAAAAVGLMVLERAAERGGTAVSRRVARDLRENLTRSLSSRDVMKLEVEAYELMSWLVGLEHRPEPAPKLDGDEEREIVVYDPDSSVIELLERAIDEEFDVEMQYYTQSRGELNSRRVTPLAINAETYLHAYCHTRRDERVFRISRIAELSPVDGKAVRSPKTDDPKPAEGGPEQGNLF